MLVTALLVPLLVAGAQGARVDSTDAFRARISAAQAAGDSATLAATHESLGLAHWRADRFDSALVHLLASVDLFAKRQDSASVARLLNALGSTHYQAGNYELALESYVRALELRAAAGNVLGQSYIYANMGKAYEDWRQFDLALSALDSAIAFAERAGDGHALGYALNSRASVLVNLGRFAEARDHAERSLAAYYSGRPRLDAVDSASAWSINTMLLGRIDLAQGRLADAERRFASVYDRARRGGTKRGQAQAQLALGDLHAMRGDHRAAAAAFRIAAEASESIGNRAQLLDALAGLTRAEEQLGQVSAALRTARRHEALRDSIFNARTAQRVATMELEAEAARQRATAATMAQETARQAADLRRQRVISLLVTALLTLALLLVATLLRFNRQSRERETLLAARNAELQAALAEVQTLSGFIPICASCKNVRDDAGYWQSVEAYIASRSAAQFSHSICNSCGPKLYGADWEPHPAPQERAGEARSAARGRAAAASGVSGTDAP